MEKNKAKGILPKSLLSFCRESLVAAVKTGASQYVILGAERATGGRLRVMKTEPLPADTLKKRLLAAGFDETGKAFISLLGMSGRMSVTELSSVFGAIASFAAEGSTVLLDYASSAVVTGTEDSAGQGFFADELTLTLLLDKYSFLVYENLTDEDIAARYGGEPPENVSYAAAVLKGTPFINTREKILQTALRLFAQNGYEAVSVKDITDALQLTKSALYKHYSGKRDIFDSIAARMAERAAEYCIPPSGTDGKAGISELADYTENQFRFWTHDVFASRFRRMLTIEQYRSVEMSALYGKYFCSGPLEYLKDRFINITGNCELSERLAAELYSPAYLLMGVYDCAENKDEPERILHELTRKITERLINDIAQ